VTRLLVVQHEPDVPPALLGDAAATAGLDLEVVEAPTRPVPGGLDGAAGLAVLGGSMGAYDTGDHPHLVATMALIRRAAARGRPVLGICLGAQLAAAALGGRAYRGPAGLEIGWNRLELTAAGRADPVLGRAGQPGAVFHWHADTFDLPPGATLLARGAVYANQAFRLGSVIGVQWHPEVDAAVLAGWFAGPAPPPPYDEAAARAGLDAHGAAAERLLRAFCRTVAASA
jgi:GMP synthase (glutamine-hydrolysing)